jgi:hypothetical protein
LEKLESRPGILSSSVSMTWDPFFLAVADLGRIGEARIQAEILSSSVSTTWDPFFLAVADLGRIGEAGFLAGYSGYVVGFVLPSRKGERGVFASGVSAGSVCIVDGSALGRDMGSCG